MTDTIYVLQRFDDLLDHWFSDSYTRSLKEAGEWRLDDPDERRILQLNEYVPDSPTEED
jgi:hypothetical protein